MEIKYIKGSLFDAPEGYILTHACNAQGVWGSGIAKEFKKRKPLAFKNYNLFCKDPKTDNGVKKSAEGLLRVEKVKGNFVLLDKQTWEEEKRGLLETVYYNGNMVKETSLSEIRNNLKG